MKNIFTFSKFYASILWVWKITWLKSYCTFNITEKSESIYAVHCTKALIRESVSFY